MASDIWKRTAQRERKPAAATTWATLSDEQQRVFYMHNPDKIMHNTTLIIPVVEHWLKWETAHWATMKDQSMEWSIAQWGYTTTVNVLSKVKFVLFNDATGTHWFLSYHRLLDVIHMVTLTHLLEGNPLPPHKLLFSISSKGSFICTFP